MRSTARSGTIASMTVWSSSLTLGAIGEKARPFHLLTHLQAAQSGSLQGVDQVLDELDVPLLFLGQLLKGPHYRRVLEAGGILSKKVAALSLSLQGVFIDLENIHYTLSFIRYYLSHLRLPLPAGTWPSRRQPAARLILRRLPA
jgi:hypothetical protein